MKRTGLIVFVLLTMLLVSPAEAPADPVEFELLTHGNNIGLLPQPAGQAGLSGDHLLQTADDISAGSFNPDGCFSFNFMNPVGISEPDYPPGYAEGIHSMKGSLTLDTNLQAGGALEITSLAFDGYVAPSKSSAQWLDGASGSGTYAASAASNWALQANFNWCYDSPFAGSGTTDMTFDNYLWNGFIIPVGELTMASMDVVNLDDCLGYFPGTSGDFESWLLSEVAPQLPQNAGYLLFAQGQAHPDWTHPMMGMTTDGIVGETIIAYAVPEPATICFLTVGICCLRVVKSSQSRKRNSRITLS